ncbi:hypothetical protein ACFSTC_56835 [Nonomuraea ferruginea]
MAGAEAELRALLDDSRRVLGEQHSDTIATALNLGGLPPVAGPLRGGRSRLPPGPV